MARPAMPSPDGTLWSAASGRATVGGLATSNRSSAVAGIEQVEERGIGAGEPARLVHDQLEDRARLPDRRQPGGDLAQGLLRLGTLGQGLARLTERIDQPRIGDRDRRLGSERGEDLRVAIVERVACLGDHVQRPEGAGLAQERRREDRVHARRVHIRVDVVVMREPRVLDIAARVLRLAGLDGQAREALVLGHGRAPEARVIVDVAEFRPRRTPSGGSRSRRRAGRSAPNPTG